MLELVLADVALLQVLISQQNKKITFP